MHSLIHHGTVSKIRGLMSITLYMFDRTYMTTQLIIMPVKTGHFMQKNLKIENQSIGVQLVHL